MVLFTHDVTNFPNQIQDWPRFLNDFGYIVLNTPIKTPGAFGNMGASTLPMFEIGPRTQDGTTIGFKNTNAITNRAKAETHIHLHFQPHGNLMYLSYGISIVGKGLAKKAMESFFLRNPQDQFKLTKHLDEYVVFCTMEALKRQQF